MPTAIIVSFEYRSNCLSGAIVDIYRAWSWFRSFDCSVVTISDIRQPNEDVVKDAIEAGIIKVTDRNFYSRLSPRIVTRSVDLVEILESITAPDQKLIVYYSGHGQDDSLLLPDQSLLPFLEFRNAVLANLSSSTELFCIIDCCNPTGWYLPFNLAQNRFVLSSSKISCVEHSMLLITSAGDNEKSASTSEGSIFTRFLFQHLTNMSNRAENQPKPQFRAENRNLQRLMANVTSSIRTLHTGYPQTVSIYSSYIVDPVFSLWLGRSNSTNVSCDYTLSTLLIS